MGFFQGDLVNNFGYSDDETINSLVICEAELRRAKLDLPPPAADSSELPTQPFGLFVPPSVEQVIGRRTIETDTELIRGRDRRAIRRDSRLSISIPPDGGPVLVESFDLQSTSRTIARVDEEENGGRVGNGRNRGGGGFGDVSGKSFHTAADQRRLNYAATNGKASGVNTKTAASGASIGGGPASSRQQKQSFSRKGTKSTERQLSGTFDSAAPQQYGVTVRL